MLFLKYICAVVAIFSTCIFFSNIIVDIGSAITWRTSLSLQGSQSVDDTAKQYATIRLILSLIMGLSWAGVIVL